MLAYRGLPAGPPPTHLLYQWLTTSGRDRALEGCVFSSGSLELHATFSPGP